jgi:DNA-binding transcriptional LysR family regulator
MRDFDLTTLRLFVDVCETGNMARASERANIVGSAISKRISQLEEQLGAQLLSRKRHGVAPTQAGRAVLEHARTMLDAATRMEAIVRSMAAGASGQVRVLASVSAMAEFLADDVAKFLAQAQHRSIQVDIEERNNPEIARGVLQGMASLGVCWDATDLGGLQTRAYRSDELCVVVPRGHPLAALKKAQFADTLHYEQVSLPVNSAMQVRLQQLAAVLGATLRHRIIVSNFEAALRVVRAGLAISLVPRTFAEPVASAFGVKLLALDETWATRQFVVCFRDEEGLTEPARRLLGYLCPGTSDK